MTMLYPNSCYNEVCYNGTALYFKKTINRKCSREATLFRSVEPKAHKVSRLCLRYVVCRHYTTFKRKYLQNHLANLGQVLCVVLLGWGLTTRMISGFNYGSLWRPFS